MGRREIINLFYRIHGKIEIIFGLSYLLDLKGWTQSNGIELVVQSSSGFKGRLWTWNDQNRTIRFEVLSDSNMKIHLIVRLLSFQELNKMNCQHTFAIDPNEMGIRCLLEDIPCSNEDFRALTIHTVWPISQASWDWPVCDINYDPYERLSKPACSEMLAGSVKKKLKLAGLHLASLIQNLVMLYLLKQGSDLRDSKVLRMFLVSLRNGLT